MYVDAYRSHRHLTLLPIEPIGAWHVRHRHLSHDLVELIRHASLDGPPAGRDHVTQSEARQTASLHSPGAAPNHVT
jgi:hypothetical protein